MGPFSRLASGGIIANYKCQAACGHCMYGCSPSAAPGYITEDAAREICGELTRLGGPSLHIGGGEPFIDIEGLENLVRVVVGSKLPLDYIETNAAWVTGDGKRDLAALTRISDAAKGAAFMVSADPFHVEFIPFWKTDTLIGLLHEKDIPFFVWQRRYLPLLKELDPYKTYGRDELKEKFGYDVHESCAREYGLGYNGRALNLLRSSFVRKDPTGFLQSKPCGQLTSAGHFHVDLFKRYVPPGCTGMGIEIGDLDKDLETDNYPAVKRLMDEGLRGLWEYAVSRGFVHSAEGYASKCELCYEMRKFLIKNDRAAHPDLTPEEYYSQDF